MNIAFWILAVFNLTIILGSFFDRAGDAATKGLGRSLALVWTPFAAVAAAVYLLSHLPVLKIGAVLVLSVPILVPLGLAAMRTFRHRTRQSRDDISHLFRDRQARELAKAIECDDLETLRARLVAGANPNAEGREGITLLWFAMGRGKVDAAILLMEHGADVNRAPLREESVLVKAAGDDRFATVLEAALKRGADPNTQSRDWPAPLLFEALKTNARRNVGILIRAGARVDIQNDKGRSAVVQAVLLKMWDEAREMLERGAPVESGSRWESLSEIFPQTTPPDPGTPERAAFDRLATVLADRGIRRP